MRITIPVAVEAPTPAQVEGWLVRHGWARHPDVTDSMTAWRSGGVPGDAEIPYRVDAPDYPRLLAVALRDVAFVAGIAPADLVAQMTRGELTTYLRSNADPTPAEARDNRVTEAMRLAGVVLRDPDDVIEMIRRLAEKIGATTDTTAKIAEILDREIP